ncbi:MAG: winged helix-turn-helix domain-containing protein [Hyphomicrobiales bacterium]
MASYTKAHRPDSFIRVHLAPSNAIGPGKADLLESIAETGSIAESARRMGMSYRRAWSLVRSLNGAFNDPLIETRKGGRSGGSAVLTGTGREVLRLYRGMETGAAKAISDDIAAFRKLLARRS